MDREQAKEEVRQREPDFLQKAKQKINGRYSYICPSCNNGSGSSGTGIVLDPASKPPRYKCFKCGLREDVIGLWRLHSGISDDKEAFKALYEYYGIQVDGAGTMYQNQLKNEHIHNTQTQHTPETDYTDFFLQANKDLEKTDYHRGISLDTLNRFKVGYVENWTHPKKPNAQPSPRLIIPVSRYSYVARHASKEDYINGNGEVENKSKAKGRDVVSWTFNLQALQKAQKPIYVVEGELDALSIIDVGGEAIAIGSTANVRRFLEELKNNPPAQPLIISLDEDEAGQTATAKLKEGLEAARSPYIEFSVSSPYKDPNEALNAATDHFKAQVEAGERKAQVEAQREKEAEKEEYYNTSVAGYIDGFLGDIAARVDTPFIPTGFSQLDNMLDGGLYEGLYIIGAISSLGKTTLALQIIDQIAQSGTECLVFSLEMARAELMAKSISRHTVIEELEMDVAELKNAKTTRGITTGTRYVNYSKEERELIETAVQNYGKYAGRIFIHEGVGNIGTEKIREDVERHISITGRKPVVLVDYVQILAPADIRATDKQNTDKNVLELKRISRDFKIPVIGVSSFNRASYREAVAMEAFKESGSLEYGSDVLIGLQLKGAGGQDFDATAAKIRNPREVELVILKNRNGAIGRAIEYEYYPMFNYFKEGGDFKPITDKQDIPFN